MQRNDFARAAQMLTGAAALAPAHPEVLRLQGLLLSLSRRAAEAIPLLQRAVQLRPDDPATLNDLAGALQNLGDDEGAAAAWRRACEIAPDFVAGWFNLGKQLKTSGRTEAALEPLAQAVALAPGNVQMRDLYAHALIDSGRFDDAVAQFKAALKHQPTFGLGWWGLAKIATRRFDDEELRQLEKLLRHHDLADNERMPMNFALGKAYEDRARFADAFAAYRTANLLARSRRPWNAGAFTGLLDGVLAAFANAPRREPVSDLGKEIIFLVSLPRAGSTLAEQILSAHRDVEGAGELTDLSDVLKEESRRRGREFPQWVADMTGEDWERLGRRYLERTARWRERHPRSTDKLPNNWFFIGAIRAMLPGARIVDCRRDALETCWSCYKQLFASGVEFTYDFDDLGAFWHDYDRSMRIWREHSPAAIYTQDYEALVDAPEAQIRALLAFCELDFDPACLKFHETSRNVRTASAAQVREPLRNDTARAASYGELLAPLRLALARGNPQGA